MRRTLFRAAALLGLFVAPAALAQQPQVQHPHPRITSVFPTGAKAGTTVEVTVAGTDLDDATGLTFSHPGLRAEVVPAPKPDPKAKTPPPPRRQGQPGQPSSVKFQVTAAPDTPVGQYDLRVVNRFGVSNPRAFVIGNMLEVEELEPNDDAVSMDPPAAVSGGPTTVPVPGRSGPRAQRIELGTTVHGVIGAQTDVDYVVFAGKAGQRVLASCLASSIDSRARPLVEVYDPAGRRLALNRNYSGNDALADITLPTDGDYFVRVSEFAYQQGGPDYFYRLTVGTGPWIDAVFPLAVNPGKPTPVTVYGRNLPGGKPVPGMQLDGRPVESLSVTVTAPTDPTKLAVRGRVAPPMGLQDAFDYRLPGSNAVPVFLTDAKLHVEKDAPNDKSDAAEEIVVPCEVAGSIGKRYDRDFYRFAAKKGDTFFIEVVADRVGSASDVYLRVRNDKGGDASPELDDDQDVLHPITFFTRNSDPPAFKFVAPDDGKFLILVGSIDANVSYGPRCGYRLRVSAPAPDFRAIVMARHKDQPTANTLRPDGEAAYDVYVGRRDGFTGPVTVSAEGLPPGVTAKPATVGTNMKWGTLVVSAAANAAEFTGPVTVKCSATIDGKPVVREARPATITWGVPQQQNVPTVTRLDQQLALAVRPERAPFRITADLTAAKLKTKDKDGKDKEEKVDGPIYVKPGDKLTVPVKVAWHEKDARPNPVTLFVEPMQQNMNQAPLSVPGGGGNPPQPAATIAKDKADGPLTIDVRSNAAPGTYAVVIRGETQCQYARDPEQKDKKAPVTALAFAQPIEVTVLPTTVGKLTATVPGSLKLGATGELVLKVERQNDYAGEFKVTVALPKDVKGLSVKDLTIPAGKDEVKVPIEVAKDAKPGNVQNVTVTATGTVHGKFAISQEAKFNLNVVK